MNHLLQDAARLYAARDYQAAEAVCHAIVRDTPNHFDALHLLGVLLTLQDRPEDALPYLRRGQAERPGHPQLQVNLGNALLATKRYQAAIEASQAADPQSLNNLGLAYKGLQQHEQAVEAFRRATALRFDYAPAWFNLATTLAKLHRLEDALQAAITAQRVAPLDTPVPRLAEITNEVGRILMDIGRPHDALAACRDFLTRHPGENTVIWNMSLCLLLLGDFQNGWRAYQHRFDIQDHDKRPEGATVLDITQVTGKRVLILSEQGRGDMLHCVRYAPLLAERGATVAVQTYPDLLPLLAAMPGVTSAVSTDDPRPPADFVTPVMSLPLAFGTHPANVPYLRVPPERRTLQFGPRRQQRIGLAWSGSPQSYDRSAIPAETLAPLLALPGYEFHCLQKEIAARDQAWLDIHRPPIVMHTRSLGDFADTAALIDQMDVIVSIDTAVAHLAGALAKPLNLLLPFNPDWRWMLGRTDSPWYPTARLFRQPSRGNWATAVQGVIAALPPPG